MVNISPSCLRDRGGRLRMDPAWGSLSGRWADDARFRGPTCSLWVKPPIWHYSEPMCKYIDIYIYTVYIYGKSLTWVNPLVYHAFPISWQLLGIHFQTDPCEPKSWPWSPRAAARKVGDTSAVPGKVSYFPAEPGSLIYAISMVCTSLYI